MIFQKNTEVPLHRELGTLYLTPVPFIFDSTCIFGGIINIPLMLILGRTLIPIIQSSHNSKEWYIILNIGIISSTIGACSYSLIGIFSLDRVGPNGLLHGIFSVFAFGGFTLSITLISGLIIVFPLKIPKILGVNGLCCPLFLFGLNFLFTIPILEWLLLFSILIFLVPVYLKTLFS